MPSRKMKVNFVVDSESDTESLFDDAVGDRHLNALYSTPITKFDCETQTSNGISHFTINNSSKSKQAEQLDSEIKLNKKKKWLMEKLDAHLSKREIAIEQRMSIVENISNTIDLFEELLFSGKFADDFGKAVAHSSLQIASTNNCNSPGTSSKIVENSVEEEAVSNLENSEQLYDIPTSLHLTPNSPTPVMKVKKGNRNNRSRVIDSSSEEEEATTENVKSPKEARRRSERIRLQPPREPRSRFFRYITYYSEPHKNDQLVEALCQSMKRQRSKAKKSTDSSKKRKLYSTDRWLSQLSTDSSDLDNSGTKMRRSF